MSAGEADRTQQLLRLLQRRCLAPSLHKLAKLLYLIDVAHVQATGKPVTVLSYVAEVHGPGVLNMGPLPRGPAELDVFTPRQHKIIAWLILQYGTAQASAIDVSIADEGAWRRALDRAGSHTIDLLDAIPAQDPHRQAKLEIADEHRRQRDSMESLRG